MRLAKSDAFTDCNRKAWRRFDGRVKVAVAVADAVVDADVDV